MNENSLGKEMNIKNTDFNSALEFPTSQDAVALGILRHPDQTPYSSAQSLLNQSHVSSYQSISQTRLLSRPFVIVRTASPDQNRVFRYNACIGPCL